MIRSVSMDCRLVNIQMPGHTEAGLQVIPPTLAWDIDPTDACMAPRMVLPGTWLVARPLGLEAGAARVLGVAPSGGSGSGSARLGVLEKKAAREDASIAGSCTGSVSLGPGAVPAPAGDGLVGFLLRVLRGCQAPLSPSDLAVAAAAAAVAVAACSCALRLAPSWRRGAVAIVRFRLRMYCFNRVPRVPSMRESLRRMVAFQWFFTAFSVLPGIILAMSAHLLPICLWASIRSFSSSSSQASLLMSGRSWLCHRSRHCLPMRPGKCLAMTLQLPSPCSRTSLREAGRFG